MAVYTEVSDEDLNTFIAQYPLGAVLSCKGIAEGVENSNYLLVTETGPYILTLYEKRTRRDDLPFFLGLMEHLAAKGVGCPVPLHGHDGDSPAGAVRTARRAGDVPQRHVAPANRPVPLRGAWARPWAPCTRPAPTSP